MCNPAISPQRLFQALSAKAKSRSLGLSVAIVTLGATVGWTPLARAESPETAPPQLQEILSEIDAAANDRDVEAVMQFYASDFVNSDGLTREKMEAALQQLWERYPQLTYRTELQSWERENGELVAETVTYITGSQPNDDMPIALESMLRSRQHVEGEKIVKQDILAEQTMLMSGENPPTVEVNLPEQVRVGQQYNFDVIVQEPLGNSLLLGTAFEEPVQTERYLDPAELDLELLQAGGIFKVGRAPLLEDEHWISAVLIRGDGMTLITRRLQVVERSSASN